MVPMNPRLLRPTRPRRTVPGAPTVTMAVETMQITWLPPVSDGGSPITLYRVYIDGVLAETITAPDTSSIDSAAAGSVVTVSAVNAVGEGPKSAPATVTA